MGYQKTSFTKRNEKSFSRNCLKILKWLMVCQPWLIYQSTWSFNSSWRSRSQRLHLSKDIKKFIEDSLVRKYEIVSKSCDGFTISRSPLVKIMG